MSAIPWDAGLSPDVILAVEAAAGAATGTSLAEEEALTPTTGNITAATIEATPQGGNETAAAQTYGAGVDISPLPEAPALVIIEAFMGAERTQESGSFDGNYTVVNGIGCRGAYQFCPGTDMYAKAEAAGWTKAAQDQIAAAQMEAYYAKFGSWQAVAQAWYGGPGNVGITGDTQDDPTILEYSIQVINLANIYLGNYGNYQPIPYPLGGGPVSVPSTPPVNESGPPASTASLPQGVPHPPRYIESFVDGLINDIPSIPIVGSAVKSALRFILDPVAAGIDAMLDWSVGALNDVWGDVTAGFGQIETAAENAFTDAKDFANTVGQEVLGDAEHLYNVVEGDLHDVESGALTLIEAGVDEAIGLAKDAENGLTSITGEVVSEAAHLIDAGVTDAKDFATSAVADLKSWAETGLADVAKGAEDIGSAAESFATAAVADLRQWATDALNDVGDFAAAALKTVEDDVIAPIFNEVEHIASDILPGIADAVSVVEKVLDWLKWLASVPFTLASTTYDTLTTTSAKEFALAAVERFNADEGATMKAFAEKVNT